MPSFIVGSKAIVNSSEFNAHDGDGLRNVIDASVAEIIMSRRPKAFRGWCAMHWRSQDRRPDCVRIEAVL